MTQDELRMLLARAIFADAVGAEHWESDWYSCEREGCVRAADATFSALRDAGLAIVPKAPSEAMQYAGSDGPMKLPERGEDALPVTANIYRAMLSAGDLLGERGS